MDFWEEGDDLHTRTAVTREQANLEGDLIVTLPDGTRAVVKLSRMLKDGYSLRAPLAGLNGAKGYLIVHFEIEDFGTVV